MSNKKIYFLTFFCFFVFCIFAASESSLMKKATKLYKAKKYKEAYSAFEKVTRKNPDNYQAYLYMGYCAIALKDKNKAIENIENSLEIKDNKALRKYLQQLKTGKKVKKSEKEPYYYKGSISRNFAMALPEIVIRDSSVAFDLYGGAGNTAGLSLREKKNYIISDILFFNYYLKTELSALPLIYNLYEVGGYVFLIRGKLTYWITKKDTISTDLIYCLLNNNMKQVTERMMGPNINYSCNLSHNNYIGVIEYSCLILKNFSAGIVFQPYLSLKPSEFPVLPEGVSYSTSPKDKIGFGLSACFKPDLQIGKLVTGIIIKNYNSYNFSVFEPLISTTYIDLFNFETVGKAQGAGTYTISRIREDVSGIITDISASFEKGTLQILSKIGLTFGIGAKVSGEDKITDETTGNTVTIPLTEYEKIRDGMAINIQLKSRYGLNIFDFGLGIELLFGGYKMFDNAVDTQELTRSLNFFKLILGTSIKPITTLIFPVEFFYGNSSTTDKENIETINYNSGICGKLGAEYLLTKEIALRAGVLYSIQSRTQKVNGIDGPASGTEANPNTNALQLSFGAGYNLKPMQFDLVVLSTFGGPSPVPSGTSSSDNNFFIMFSSLIPL